MRLRTGARLAALATLVGLGLFDVSATAFRATTAQVALRAPTVEAAAAGQTWTEEPAHVAPGLPPTVTARAFAKATISYPVFSPSGEQIGLTQWRVISGTGNCCENHIGITKTGRLIDFGGAYLEFSDDQGKTWSEVRPQEPLVGPEGTVVNAPGGDILGVTWDPYTGDRLLSFKMDGSTKEWSYMYTPLHTPFYDREWIAVIPGPHTIAGQTVPYISVLRGGFPSKAVWYYSLDGLHYVFASNKALTQIAGGSTNAWLPTTPDPEADWTQPISESTITPLNGGGALARGEDALDTGTYRLAPGSLLWSEYQLGDGTPLPGGRLALDSRGWAHLVNVGGGSVSYQLSKDGGQTWAATTAPLPSGFSAENWDFRASGALGVTAVAIHAHDGNANKDQDLVLRFATACGAPELVRTQYVGKGDVNASSGLGADVRFDFATTGLFPDGRVATSILDSAHQAPAVAVEVGTTYNVGYVPPPLSCGVPAP